MKAKTRWIALVALGTALLTLTSAQAVDKKNAATVPTSSAFGEPFGDWMADFWAWNYGGVGSALQPNGVYFLPIPVPAADAWALRNGRMIGTAETSVTIKPGTKIVLGILAWIGETYQKDLGIPDDQPWAKSEFLPPKGDAVITLDGVELINAENMGKFYFGPAWFDEPITYAQPTSYGSIGALWVQGTGIVLKPLTPGEHVLHLYSWDYWKGAYGNPGVGWDNTWHITVQPPGAGR